MMPESTDDSEKANINHESHVKEDSEYVRLVIRNERSDEVGIPQSKSQSRKEAIVWWIKAMIWCIFTVIILLVSIKWGAPIFFEKVSCLYLCTPYVLIWLVHFIICTSKKIDMFPFFFFLNG